jgi:hypothetical protein
MVSRKLKNFGTIRKITSAIELVNIVNILNFNIIEVSLIRVNEISDVVKVVKKTRGLGSILYLELNANRQDTFQTLSYL